MSKAFVKSELPIVQVIFCVLNFSSLFVILKERKADISLSLSLCLSVTDSYAFCVSSFLSASLAVHFFSLSVCLSLSFVLRDCSVLLFDPGLIVKQCWRSGLCPRIRFMILDPAHTRDPVHDHEYISWPWIRLITMDPAHDNGSGSWHWIRLLTIDPAHDHGSGSWPWLRLVIIDPAHDYGSSSWP